MNDRERTRMRAQSIRIGLGTVLAMGMLAAPVFVQSAAEAEVTLDPTPVEVVSGEAFTVTLQINNVPEPGMAAYDFRITFTPGVVEFGTSAGDHEWPDSNYGQPFVFNVDNTVGHISFNDIYTSIPAPSGNITLVVFHGTAIGTESLTTDLHFDKVDILDPDGEDIQGTIEDGRVRVRTEPVLPPPPVPPVVTVTLTGLEATIPLKVDAEGFVQVATSLTTPDVKLRLDIPAGTKMLDAQGNPLASISVEPKPSPPTPPPEAAIILAYGLGPDGATFKPLIALTMEYDPDVLPEGLAEQDLYIAYWDGTEWRFLETTVDTTARTASCQVSRFTTFAVVSTSPMQYDLTISSTAGGSVTEPGDGFFTYDEGTVIYLVADVEEGYRFANWTGDVGTIDNANAATTTIIIDGDYEIIANFIAQYNLTIDSTDGGGVNTPGEGTFTYDKGTVVNLVVEPEQGYQFVNWTGNVSTIADVNTTLTTITMDDQYSITANFKARVNWALLGGIIAAVLAVGLGIFFFRRGRVA